MSSNVLPIALAAALLPDEAARPVPGASRYWVTTRGRVFSLVRGVRELRATANGRGYFGVDLSRDPDRDDGLPRRLWCYVHHLVALAFIGPRPVEPGVAFHVDHIDGDKANNSVGNLRYVTQSENLQYAIASGLNTFPKLKVADVWRLRCLAASDGERAAIDEGVRVHSLTVLSVRRTLSGRTWAGVPQPADRPDAEALARALQCSKAEAWTLLKQSPFGHDRGCHGSARAERPEPRILPLQTPPEQAA